MLEEIVKDKSLTAKAVLGFYPAESVGDDILLYGDEAKSEKIAVLPTLRQQLKKSTDKPNFALADFIAPADSSVDDYIGLFALSTGFGVAEKVAEYTAEDDEYNAIMIKLIADRLAEAFSEYLHEKVRKEFWGYAPDESYTMEEILKSSYQGIRPAPGYPANPYHPEKGQIFNLMNVTEEIGLELTDSFMMNPAAAVSGVFYAHPDSAYFSVGKINDEQVTDFAERLGAPVEETAKWLKPNLE